jgi:hypothetical protein
VNTGRPVGDGENDDGEVETVADSRIEALHKDIIELQAKVSESRSKGRTQRTIEKWEERLAEAKEALAKAEIDARKK